MYKQIAENKRRTVYIIIGFVVMIGAIAGLAIVVAVVLFLRKKKKQKEIFHFRYPYTVKLKNILLPVYP